MKKKLNLLILSFPTVRLLSSRLQDDILKELTVWSIKLPIYLVQLHPFSGTSEGSNTYRINFTFIANGKTPDIRLICRSHFQKFLVMKRQEIVEIKQNSFTLRK